MVRYFSKSGRLICIRSADQRCLEELLVLEHCLLEQPQYRSVTHLPNSYLPGLTVEQHNAVQLRSAKLSPSRFA